MRSWMLLVGPLLGLALGGILYHSGSSADVAWTAGVTLLTALWWVFEPIPIPATSLIPLAVFPLIGVLTAEEVGSAYGDPMILLLLGGFMLSVAMEQSGAHRRIALGMVRAFGGSSGRRLVLGFMAASAVLSMWISNSATTLMLLPIALAVIEKSTDERLSIALLLGIAYAASIGGVGTPIGTPPNLIFIQKYYEATGIEITFLQWMGWALPVVLIMFVVAGVWLTRSLTRGADIDLPRVGAWRAEEIRTLSVFAITASLWMTRTGPWGGWSDWVGLPQANDASVALLGVVAMFLVPNGKGKRLLTWEAAARIPWGVLLLFSSGIVIAQAFSRSGLSDVIGHQLAEFGNVPTFVLIGMICLAVTFLTEVTSNTAVANLVMPILAAMAVALDMDAKLLMVPATVCATFAFMLPVATAPNAVVYGSGHLTINRMAREGVVLNLLGVLTVVTVYTIMFE